MADTIVYLVKSKSGGIDGRDHTDRGGKILFASKNKEDAEARLNGWSELEPAVVDYVEVCKRAIAKLDPLECLAMRIFGTTLLREKDNHSASVFRSKKP